MIGTNSKHLASTKEQKAWYLICKKRVTLVSKFSKSYKALQKCKFTKM